MENGGDIAVILPRSACLRYSGQTLRVPTRAFGPQLGEKLSMILQI